MDATKSEFSVEPVGDDADAATVRTQFDREQTSASMAVVTTLAEVLDADPAELEPLYGAVDTDALDSLVHAGDGSGGDTHISFSHEGHGITVSSYGVVTITAAETPSPKHDGRDAER